MRVCALIINNTEACWWIILKDVRHVEMLQKSWGWDDRWCLRVNW
jgi:hypothetical protein